MRSKWMGVALAAVMACGWAGGAEAYTVKVAIEGTVTSGTLFNFPQFGKEKITNLANKPFSFLFNFRTENLIGGEILFNGLFLLNIGDIFRDAIPTDDVIFQEDSQNFYGTLGYAAGGCGADNCGGIYKSIEFDFRDPDITKLGLHDGSVQNPVTTLAIYNNDSQIFGTNGVLADAKFSVQTVSISTVPLPASAPLFGAAILALGAAGYEMKRRKAA